MKQTNLSKENNIESTNEKTLSLSGKPNSFSLSKRKIFVKLTLAALLMAFATQWFVLSANIYSAGLSGTAQGLSYFLWDVWGVDAFTNEETFKSISFWVTNIIFNIGILIFSYKYFGKKFVFYSTYAFGLAAAFGFLFSIPSISSLSFFEGEQISSSTVALFSAVIAGILYGISAGVIFSVGASLLGTDPISKYISRKYLKSISLFLVIFTLLNTLFWVILTAGVAGEISTFNDFMELIFSIPILATIMFLATYSFAISFIYSPTRKLKVEINSLQSTEISLAFKKVNIRRSYTIINVVGGYTGKNRKIIEILINSEELQELMAIIDQIDSECFVTITEIKKIYGSFNKGTWLGGDTIDE